MFDTTIGQRDHQIYIQAYIRRILKSSTNGLYRVKDKKAVFNTCLRSKQVSLIKDPRDRVFDK